jgi:hypothetical protein
MGTLNNRKLIITTLLLVQSITGAGAALAQGNSTPIPESNSMAATLDTAYPSDVENVKASAGDKLINLSWDASTDNVGVKGYKIFYGTASVSSDKASYTMGPVDAGNALTYNLKNLLNDTTYYFAVTAYDAAGNESEFYSAEVSATPKAGLVAALPADDKTAPKVVNAVATFKNTVKVTFSEGVKLPVTGAEAAFSAKDDSLGTALNVSKAELDSADKSNKTVLLTTADQKKNSKYILTAGIQIKDLAGNPIVSGTSDTAVFSGTDAMESVKPAAQEQVADLQAPAFVGVKALSGTTVEVTFSEPVVLLNNAAENFIVTDAADNTKITNVTKVVITENGTKATLTTENLEAKKYNLIAIKVKDIAGNMMEVQNSATTFDGVAGGLVTPPVDGVVTVQEAASDLVAKAVASMMVNLSWQAKMDQMAGVANFVVYMSTDRGATYGEGKVLGKDALTYDFGNLTEDMVYYFKLTTRNAAGQESEGLVTYLTLPKTGPELALLFLTSAGGGYFFTKKKKK